VSEHSKGKRKGKEKVVDVESDTNFEWLGDAFYEAGGRAKSDNDTDST